MDHQLGLRGRSRCEVQEHRLIGRRRGPEARKRIGLVTFLEAAPSAECAPDRDAQRRPRQAFEFGRPRVVGKHRAHAAPGEAVLEIRPLQKRSRRNDHRAQLDRRQHGFPKSRHVAQHKEQSVSRQDPLILQPVGHLVGSACKCGEGQGLVEPRIIHQAQRTLLVAGGDAVKIVARPVEMAEMRPLECALRLRGRDPVAQEPIPKLDECLAAVHGPIMPPGRDALP